jgi:hypothetical protein
VGLRQEKSEVGKLWFVPRQLGKQPLHATVGLRRLAQSCADQRLRRMKAGQIGIPAGVFSDTGGENDARAGETLARLIVLSFLGVTNRRPRVDSPPSAASGSDGRRPGTAWRQ